MIGLVGGDTNRYVLRTARHSAVHFEYEGGLEPSRLGCQDLIAEEVTLTRHLHIGRYIQVKIAPLLIAVLRTRHDHQAVREVANRPRIVVVKVLD